MDKKLKGQVAIVTGAARGMGRSHAHRLARLGANVIITDIRLDAAKEYDEPLMAPSVCEEIEAFGVECLAFEGDITDRGFVNGMVESVQRRFGQVDVLVNNAGGAISPFERSMASTTSDEDLDHLLAVNFRGSVNTCQAVLPLMKARRTGSIINISTINANEWKAWGSGVLSGYAAAKAALNAYSRHLATEVGPFGIRVNLVAPGLIATSRVAALAEQRGVGTKEQAKRIPLRRTGTSEDASRVVEFLATDLSLYVTGQTLNVCGGMSIVGD